MTASASSASWSEGQVDVDGVSLHFHRTGRMGLPPLILAHGLSDSGRCWTRVADALGEHFDVVMPDARNHGRSDTAITSSDLLVSDVAAIVAALGLETPAVMGHSVGAQTMAMLAARHPNLVSQLVLEDPPWTAALEHGPDETSGRRRDEIAAWLGSFAGLTDDDIAGIGRDQHPQWPDEEFPSWIESNRQVRVQAAGGLDFDGWGAVVVEVTCPTLLVHGEADRGGIVTPSVAARVTELNPHVEVQAVDGAGHNIRRENLGRFIEVTRDFLLAHRTASSK